MVLAALRSHTVTARLHPHTTARRQGCLQIGGQVQVGNSLHQPPKSCNFGQLQLSFFCRDGRRSSLLKCRWNFRTQWSQHRADPTPKEANRTHGGQRRLALESVKAVQVSPGLAHPCIKQRFFGTFVDNYNYPTFRLPTLDSTPASS